MCLAFLRVHSYYLHRCCKHHNENSWVTSGYKQSSHSTNNKMKLKNKHKIRPYNKLLNGKITRIVMNVYSTMCMYVYWWCFCVCSGGWTFRGGDGPEKSNTVRATAKTSSWDQELETQPRPRGQARSHTENTNTHVYHSSHILKFKSVRSTSSAVKSLPWMTYDDLILSPFHSHCPPHTAHRLLRRP